MSTKQTTIMICKVTAALSLAVIVSCYGHDEKQVADTNTNWLDCDTDDDCDDGLMCVDGTCSDGMPQRLDAAQDADVMRKPATPPVQVGLRLDGEPLRLSDEGSSPSGPFVRAIDDHWSVAWDARTATPERVLYAVDIARDGLATATHVVMLPTFSPFQSLVGMSAHGVLAMRDDRGLRECALTFVRWETGEMKSTAIPCTDMSRVSDVEGSDAWLVTSSESEELQLGVYSLEDGWTTWLTPIGQRAGESSLALDGNGGSASVLWGNRDATRGVDIADVSDPAAGTALERLDGAVDSDGPYDVVRLADRSIAVGVRGAGVWSSVIRGGVASSAATVAEARVYAEPPRVVASERGALLAVCFMTMSTESEARGLMVMVIDSEGRPSSEPMRLSEDSQHCDLAWLDDALLVVWDEIERGEEGVPTDRSLIAQRVAVVP